MSEESNIDIYRRRFLSGTATTAAGLALAPGVMLTEVANAKPADEAVTSEVRWGMLIDTNKCNEGCDDCVTACNEEHNLEDFGRPSTDAQWIRKVSLKDKQTGTPAVRRRMPDRRLLQARRRYRAGRQSHLHWLSLLHDGLPLQGTLVCA